MNWQEVQKMSIDELNQHLAEGGKFVRYTYCISIVIMTFQRESDIYFIRKQDNAVSEGLPYTLLTLLLGWWGIPFGPIYSIIGLVRNLGGGRDVTEDVINAFNASSDNQTPQ